MGADKGLPCGLIRVIFGIQPNRRILFMRKRLPQKNTPLARSKVAGPVGPPPARPNRFHGFLRRLRAGGRSNMYGAIPYLMHAFALDRETAFRVVCEWVDQQAAEAPRAAEASSAR
jgi:hypothetical protein